MDFLRRNTLSNTDSSTQTNINSGPVMTATIPYMSDTSETIKHIRLDNLCSSHLQSESELHHVS